MFRELPYLIDLDAKYSKKSNVNYIDPSISYGMDNTTKNPYLSVIDEFQKYPSLGFSHKDLAYLKNIGNLPINKLVILRRFAEGSSPSVNLLAYGGRPISTVIGWIKEDESFPSIKVNEEWTTVNKRLDSLLVEMIKNEFGIPMDMLAPVPGWAQGFLMNFYNAMGITDMGAQNQYPFGNPNVLLEATTRNSALEGNFGLKSDFSFSFETTYVQKSIGGLDPGVELFSRYNNLLAMGTSNTEYLMTSGSTVIDSLRTAVNGNTWDAWLNFAAQVVKAFVNAIGAAVKTAITAISGEKNKSASAIKGDQGAALEGISKLIGNGLLASTLGKYRWPLRGSIGLMTGEATTPWHLTIGHPFKPFMSINNILVDSVETKWDNELDFNELPKSLTGKINCRFGRNMGKQEILRYFAQTYIRTYKTK